MMAAMIVKQEVDEEVKAHHVKKVLVPAAAVEQVFRAPRSQG